MTSALTEEQRALVECMESPTCGCDRLEAAALIRTLEGTLGVVQENVRIETERSARLLAERDALEAKCVLFAASLKQADAERDALAVRLKEAGEALAACPRLYLESGWMEPFEAATLRARLSSLRAEGFTEAKQKAHDVVFEMKEDAAQRAQKWRNLGAEDMWTVKEREADALEEACAAIRALSSDTKEGTDK